MNLMAAVGPVIAAVNPLVAVGFRSSIPPGATQADGTRPPLYATPGALTASISGTVLTATAVTQGAIQVGQTLSDLTSALAAGTTITELLAGTGGAGTYGVSVEQEVGSEAMTTSATLMAQVQALSTRDLRQVEALNLQGTLKTFYLYGDASGVVRPTAKGGDLLTLPDGSVWLITIVPEPWNLTAGWTKCVATQQNGS